MRHPSLCQGFLDGIVSPWGIVTIHWLEINGEWKIRRIYLPTYALPQSPLLPDEISRASAIIGRGREMVRCLVFGEESPMDFDCLDLGVITSVRHRHVLMLTSRIPRGRVTSYRWLAVAAGIPQAPRAIGSCMARNPFPLVIPCHRVVSAQGTLGGYGGGVTMKRELLHREGVPFQAKGRIEKAAFINGLTQ